MQSAELHRNAAQSFYAKSTARVNARFLPNLRQLDPNATDLGDQPYFMATLSPSAIAILEADPDVDTIDVSDRQPTAQLANASNVLDYKRIHAAPISITGTGVKVGQIENTGPLPAANLIPQISPFLEDHPGTGCADDGNHMERVASVLRSNDPAYQGVAPGASHFLGGNCTSATANLEGEARTAWVWGALALNNSWGLSTAVGSRPSNDDKFFDSLVFSNRLTTVHAAGNSTD